MKSSIIAIALWLFAVPIAALLQSGVSPGKASRKNPPTPKVTPVDCKLTLSFFRPDNRSCPQTPTDQANPTLNDGAPTLSSSTRVTYYCKITVEPDALPQNYNAATYKFTWTKKAPYLTIKVPKECTSKITVEFYENCNNCIGNSIGRPMWRYNGMLGRAQPTCDAFLQYSLSLYC